MKNKTWLFAVITLLTMSCAHLLFAAPPDPQDADATQRFLVLRAGRLVAPSESLTNADANCSIVGDGSDANMQCRPNPATIKTSFHYDTALLLDSKGTAYVIACRVSLVSASCKKLDPGTSVRGGLNQGHLALVDTGKVHNYDVLLFRYVGPAQVTFPVNQASNEAPPIPPTPKTPPPNAAPVNGSAAPAIRSAAPPNGAPLPAKQNKPADDASATCMSYTGACVTFLSDPLGADIYVDGKFVGDTPSTLTLPVGPHDIRIEVDKNKPWARAFDAIAGSKITLRAKLDAQ